MKPSGVNSVLWMLWFACYNLQHHLHQSNESSQTLVEFIAKSGTNLATTRYQSWCFATVYSGEMWKLTINDMDMKIITVCHICTSFFSHLHNVNVNMFYYHNFHTQNHTVLCAKCDIIN